MKVTSYAVARPAYYDRGASGVASSYGPLAVAPHAITIRWTSTIAAGFKVLVEHTYQSSQRAVVATVAGNWGSLVITGTNTLQTTAGTSNVTGVTATSVITGAITLYAGDTIYSQTYDSSTGGTVYFETNYKGTLFVA